jgi:hypothetical protein
MDKLLFWLGIGAAQKGAGSEPTKRRHPVVSLVVGALIAGVGSCRNVSFVGQPTMKRGLRRVHWSKEASSPGCAPYWSTTIKS